MDDDKGRIIRISKGCVEWEVDTFHSLLVDKWYWSPEFSFAGGKWSLWIRRERVRKLFRKKRFLLRMTRCRPADESTIGVEFMLSMKNQNRVRYENIRIKKEFGKFDESPLIPIELYVREISRFLVNDTLTVLCDLKCFGPTQSAGKDYNSGSSSLLHNNKVMCDFRELFLRKEDCDVVISVKGQEFPAHRNILKARSPVFAAIFRSNMKERATGVVEIEDCDPSCFSDFLTYLYCGVVENLSLKNVFSLFATADKYDIQDLRSECLEFVKKNLSVDTFCDTITLALRHSEAELIDLATDFFNKNAPQIILTVKWQQFLADNPTQSIELFMKFTTSIGRSNE